MDGTIDCNIDARGFSVRTGYYLAYASKCAYEEPGKWSESLGMEGPVAGFTCGQFHGFVGVLPKVVVLAFRGTQNIGNCLTDAETPLVPFPPFPGRVHLGFATAVEQVWPEVRRLLGAVPQGTPIWVTGHSLGGAMATLASVRLMQEGYAVRAVYTYGSPRVGDRLFRESYRLTNYRFVNDNDLVPHLPFRWCYKHVGKLKLLEQQGTLTEETAAWRAKKHLHAHNAKRVQRAHRGATPTYHPLGDFDWLADHHLDRYLDAIATLLPHRVRLHQPDVAATRLSPPIRRLDPAAAAITPPMIPRQPLTDHHFR